MLKRIPWYVRVLFSTRSKKNFLQNDKFMAGDEDVKVAVTEAVTEEVTEVSTQAVYEDNPGR